ncbi:hypothetical protein ZHAS_00020885 [Anopheles sinensis]|uniref:Uncharacterized protein n=1 Tax=Anopheles sinensis TaxID=74873 RepID=A0A084WQY9_ANOSI|nr:hypothetical protein ZHAS_00020885 [Anopheles sinensis]
MENSNAIETSLNGLSKQLNLFIRLVCCSLPIRDYVCDKCDSHVANRFRMHAYLKIASGIWQILIQAMRSSG